jgi:hypothetical protein
MENQHVLVIYTYGLGRWLDGPEIGRQQALGLQRGDGLRDLWSVTTARRAGAAAPSFYRAVDGATVDVPGEMGVATNQWVALCAQHGSRQM